MKFQRNLIVLTIFACSCATQPDETSMDVERLAERITTCSHLAGEVGSGDHGREDEIADSMRELDCDDEKISQDILAARARYAHQLDMLTKLETAIEIAKNEYGIEY